MKHTAGPWVIKRIRELWDSKSAGFAIIRERGTTTFKGESKLDYTVVATVPDNPRSQNAGNARLIAAAPDLAGALAWALGRMKLENSPMLGSIPYQNAVYILNEIYIGEVPPNIDEAVNTGRLHGGKK